MEEEEEDLSSDLIIVLIISMETLTKVIAFFFFYMYGWKGSPMVNLETEAWSHTHPCRQEALAFVLGFGLVRTTKKRPKRIKKDQRRKVFSD